MQRAYAYLDLGDGLRPVNNINDDIGMLAGFTVQWGTDSPDTQPDPGVCDLTLIDRTGELAGDFVRLSGAHLVIRINNEPTWDSIGSQFGTYADCAFPWRQLAGRWEPPIQDGSSHVVFDGIIGSGGTISRWKDMWMIELSATSRMVVWKRLAKQGPTSTDTRLDGYHWTGSPQQRLTELNTRAAAANAPLADTDGLDLPPSVAPYDKDTYPTQLELLQRLFAHSPDMPIWHEDVQGDTVTIGHTCLAVPAGIILDTHANPSTRDGETIRPGVDGRLVETDDRWTMKIMEPWTQATVNGHAAGTGDDDALTFDDSETTTTVSQLPQQLLDTQKTVTLDSDAILDSTVSDYPALTVDDESRRRVADWIATLDTMLVPETVVFDSRRVDPYTHPWLYQCQPSGPIFVYGQITQNLVHADGTPTVTGVWTTIGGTLTFDWADGDPVLRNECTLAPIPVDHSATLTWDDLAGWPPTYSQVHMTWAQLGIANEITTTESEEQ